MIFFIPSGRIKAISHMPLKSIIFFAMSGILAGFLGVYFYFQILKNNPSSKIVPLAATYPLVTAILSVIFLKEGFSWSRIIGTVLIVLGILLVK